MHLSPPRRRVLTAALIILFSAASRDLAAQTEIFFDQLSGNSAGWVFKARSNDVLGQFGSDSLFGFDYSALGIPEAPNTRVGDQATRGVRLRTNALGNPEDQAGVVLENSSFAGKYTVQVDMWLNWAADDELIGTTEHGGLFVGKATAQDPGDPGFPVQRGAGAIFSTDGDCSNCDHILLKNRAELDTFSGQYSVRDFGFGNQPGFDNTDVNSNAANGELLDFPAMFPTFNINTATGGAQGTPVNLDQPAGAIGFQWVTITAEIDPTDPGMGEGPGVGTAKFSVTSERSGETFVLGTVDNSVLDEMDDDMDGDTCDFSSATNQEDICTGETPVDLEGQVTLALFDFFLSTASDVNLAFALFDNLYVFAPDAGLPGDFNDDGTVDAADYTVWRDGLGTEYVAADYDIWRNNYGATASAAAATNPTPEPSAIVMIGLVGGLGLSCRRIRRRD
ncbi:MAG: PEP-CTERM sorting domain-containing protein [Planctomycetales bacterium]|nr:PEP-CTERM sorting domain-containing protein [Planctomycetales bacterium]